jgi:hypothetical protein
MAEKRRSETKILREERSGGDHDCTPEDQEYNSPEVEQSSHPVFVPVEEEQPAG